MKRAFLTFGAKRAQTGKPRDHCWEEAKGEADATGWLIRGAPAAVKGPGFGDAEERTLEDIADPHRRTCDLRRARRAENATDMLGRAEKQHR